MLKLNEMFSNRTGPLLYHFENMANELSIELSYEEIKDAILKCGFQLEVRQKCYPVSCIEISDAAVCICKVVLFIFLSH